MPESPEGLSRKPVPADLPADGTESVESYETDGLTVLYDARNPLAWIESTRTVRLDNAA